MNADLIGMLTSQLSVSNQQASGGAGLLFKLAREKLSAEQFSQLSAAVPEAATLPAAAPASGGGLMGVLGNAMGGKAGDLASLAGGFSKLGMDADMIQKFIPVVMSFVQQKGGAGVAGLLQQALKG
jgi:hypothetical protein